MQIGSILSTPTQSFLRLARTTSLTRHFSAFNPTTHHRPHLQHNIDVGDRAEGNNGRRRRPAPLQRLNLDGIWPGKKELAEEMSPRKLNRLQRLLSDNFDEQPRSPRCSLGPDRWRDYHGRHDWAGLLDPLDDNLRREIIRYGELVQSAYRTFHSNPAHPPPVSLLDRAYKVTRSLYATSALGLPEWVPPELGWVARRSSWVGFVGVCDDAGEIRRMGRRDIVVVLRGTATCLEWAENARAHLIPIDGPGNSASAHPKVQCGFWSLYTTHGPGAPSLSESIVDEVRRLVAQYEGEELSITVTGHSLGAALAVLAADELSTCLSGTRSPPVAVVSFGGPQVGNAGFANRIRSNGVKVLRVVNTRDVVTKVPYLAYSHVGCELRLDSNVSPVLKPNAGPACCHDLEAYLHLVDGFTGSDGPFRVNAKRPIWRLLNEQRSNVKKLYTNKAQQLKWLTVP